MVSDNVHTERQMRAATGLGKTQLNNLLPLFEHAYQDRYQLSLPNRVAQQTGRSKSVFRRVEGQKWEPVLNLVMTKSPSNANSVFRAD